MSSKQKLRQKLLNPVRQNRGQSAKVRLTPIVSDAKIIPGGELELPYKPKRTKEEIEAHRQYIEALAKPRKQTEPVDE